MVFKPHIPLSPRATVKGGRSLLMAAPPCMSASVPTRTNWCTRQFPEMNARSPTVTWPPSKAPFAIIMANGALLGGHVTVGDRAFISGNCLVHQFVRVGTLALMQGGAAISKDLPPFTVARGDNGMCGLNTIGLRRAGLSNEERLELKQLYAALFRSGQNLRAACAKAQKEFTSPTARVLLDLVATSRRGICRDTGIEPAPDDAPDVP